MADTAAAVAETVRKIKDLGLGDMILVKGFDGPREVRAATRVQKGTDKGKLDVSLRGDDGFDDTVRFDPEEEVTVVGKNTEKGKPSAKHAKKSTAKAKAEKAKGKAAKPEPAADKSPPKAKKAGKAKQAKAAGDKKMSALDAAARVLRETGQPMNCKELIEAMAAKGYWTTPGGRTPHATLYSAILRELQVKKADARFQKTERGKFSATDKA